MAWPTIFGNLAAGNQPLSLFDGMFNQIAQLIAIPCTASGTNAITLTLIGNAPTLTGYNNFQMFRFKAGNTSTSAVTMQFAALSAFPVYQQDGTTQIGSGGIIAGQEYMVVFDQSRNGGVGGFYLENAAQPTNAALTALINIFTSALSGAVPASGGGSINFLRADGTWTAPGAGTSISPTVQYLTATQTVTIPAGATKAEWWLIGAGGGGGGGHQNNTGCPPACTAGVGGIGGSGGGVLKYLSGLTPANTLALTIGAGGTAGNSTPGAGGTGGSTILASGTQTITTLTASGGAGGAGGNGTIGAAGASGGGTNGDLNLTGYATAASTGFTPLALGFAGLPVIANHAGSAGVNFGGGGSGGNGTTSGFAGGVGAPGVAVVRWFA